MPENQKENPMSDELLREVDEEIKEENFKKSLKKYAPALVTAIVLALACAGFFEYVGYQKKQKAMADDAALTVALDMAQKGNVDESLAALQEMRQTASDGYAVLAALHQTALLLRQDDKPAALNVLDSLILDKKIPAPVKDLALFNKVSIAVDLPNADYAALENELAPLTVQGQAWEAQAYELKAVIALKQGDLNKAKDSLTSLLAISDLTEDLRMRAAENLALIEKEIEERGQTAPEKSAGQPTEAAK